MASAMQAAGAPQSTNPKENMGVGGVVSLRSRSKSRERKGSFDLGKLGEIEDAKDEDAGLRNHNDFKRKQVGLLLFPIVSTLS